jgi:hypothetical protein
MKVKVLFSPYNKNLGSASTMENITSDEIHCSIMIMKRNRFSRGPVQIYM